MRAPTYRACAAVGWLRMWSNTAAAGSTETTGCCRACAATTFALMYSNWAFPHLGQVAGRQECGAASNGEEPLRPRAGGGAIIKATEGAAPPPPPKGVAAHQWPPQHGPPSPLPMGPTGAIQ
jgi:hypothetical protein